MASPVTPQILADYDNACIANVVPALFGLRDDSFVPVPGTGAKQTVLLVLDGLGVEQYEANRDCMPTLAALDYSTITSVVPSTTASALTSISTGVAPGEHGILGYRMLINGEVMNTLRWTSAAGDSRKKMPPAEVQPRIPFSGRKPIVITKGEFANSGFTLAHLSGVRHRGWRVPSALITNVAQALRADETFVYAYYDGIDKVAHEYGLGEHYRAELAAADELVAAIIRVLPSDTALVITADHGQIETGADVRHIHPDAMNHVAFQSGEGRLRWLHAKPGRSGALMQAVTAHHSHEAWVYSRSDARDAHLFGPRMPDAMANRLGDVCLVATGSHAFHDPADSGPFELIARHGSMTSAEMLVPLFAMRA